MRTGMRIAAVATLAVLCLPAAVWAADTPAPPHRHKKAIRKGDPPKQLFSGPTGPLRDQIPLNDMPAIAPEVSYEDGQLTIVALNSTLADILRAVSKQTGAEMDIPANANDRVVTRLGPGPARDVMAELLNGSHFNYVLLGSPKDPNVLTRIVLVANSEGPGAGAPGAPPAKVQAQPQVIGNVPPNAPPLVVPDEAQEAEDNTPDETPEPSAAEADTPANPGQPGIKTPQQLLQEMQQRQIQFQQQQQQQQTTGQPVPPPATPPNLPVRPQSEQQ